MFIEVYYKAIRVNRQFVQIPTLDALPFDERVKQREGIIKRVVADFLANVLDASQINSPDIHVALVFESKMEGKVEGVPVTQEMPIVKRLPRPHINKRVLKDEPRIALPEKEPVKYVRHKGVYSNPDYQV